MNWKNSALTFGAATILFAARGHTADYVYNVGDNPIRASGASCHAESRIEEETIGRSANGIRNQGTSVIRIHCPLQRRSTTYYGVSGLTSTATTIALKNPITVAGVDSSSASPMSCWQFRQNLDTGSVEYGSSRFFCGTSASGCSEPPASYKGTSTLIISPLNPSNKSVNYGYTCDLPPASTILFAQATSIPNSP